MRRIDVIIIGIVIFAIGGIAYIALEKYGFDSTSAGIWSQVLLVVVLLGWVSTYLFRVATKNMTYGQQRRDYEEAMLQKRLDSMTPEEIERLQAEIEEEKTR